MKVFRYKSSWLDDFCVTFYWRVYFHTSSLPEYIHKSSLFARANKHFVTKRNSFKLNRNKTDPCREWHLFRLTYRHESNCRGSYIATSATRCYIPTNILHPQPGKVAAKCALEFWYRQVKEATSSRKNVVTHSTFTLSNTTGSWKYKSPLSKTWRRIEKAKV